MRKKVCARAYAPSHFCSFSVEWGKRIDNNKESKKKTFPFAISLELHCVYTRHMLLLHGVSNWTTPYRRIYHCCYCYYYWMRANFSCKLTREMRSMLIDHLINGLPPNESGGPHSIETASMNINIHIQVYTEHCKWHKKKQEHEPKWKRITLNEPPKERIQASIW